MIKILVEWAMKIKIPTASTTRLKIFNPISSSVSVVNTSRHQVFHIVTEKIRIWKENRFESHEKVGEDGKEERRKVIWIQSYPGNGTMKARASTEKPHTYTRHNKTETKLMVLLVRSWERCWSEPHSGSSSRQWDLSEIDVYCILDEKSIFFFERCSLLNGNWTITNFNSITRDEL